MITKIAKDDGVRTSHAAAIGSLCNYDNVSDLSKGTMSAKA